LNRDASEVVAALVNRNVDLRHIQRICEQIIERRSNNVKYDGIC